MIIYILEVIYEADVKLTKEILHKEMIGKLKTYMLSK